jgi:hypothetical protein
MKNSNNCQPTSPKTTAASSTKSSLIHLLNCRNFTNSSSIFIQQKTKASKFSRIKQSNLSTVGSFSTVWKLISLKSNKNVNKINALNFWTIVSKKYSSISQKNGKFLKNSYMKNHNKGKKLQKNFRNWKSFLKTNSQKLRPWSKKLMNLKRKAKNWHSMALIHHYLRFFHPHQSFSPH